MRRNLRHKGFELLGLHDVDDIDDPNLYPRFYFLEVNNRYVSGGGYDSPQLQDKEDPKIPNPKTFLEDIKDKTKEQLLSAIRRHNGHYLQIAFKLTLSKHVTPDAIPIQRWIKLKQKINMTPGEMSDILLNTTINNFYKIIDEIEQDDSGCTLKSIGCIDLDHLGAAAIRRRGYFKTPFVNRTILNIETYDDFCIFYAIAAALNPLPSKSHPQRPSDYNIWKHELSDLEYTLAVDDITKLEKAVQLLDNNLTVMCLLKVMQSQYFD